MPLVFRVLPSGMNGGKEPDSKPENSDDFLDTVRASLLWVQLIWFCRSFLSRDYFDFGFFLMGFHSEKHHSGRNQTKPFNPFSSMERRQP